MELVRVENVHKKYIIDTQEVVALDGATLSIKKGEFAAIAGPSGSGKSTLLNMIGCIDTPSSGKVFIDGIDVSNQTPDQLSDFRAVSIGFIFQTFNLFPVLSAEENVDYPLLLQKNITKQEREYRVRKYLGIVGLSGHLKHRPTQLSGGQRQRVAIARALATEPKIILADEPTANLDSKTGAGILQLMKEINETTGATFIFSTHDQRVMDMAGNLIKISDGKIISD